MRSTTSAGRSDTSSSPVSRPIKLEAGVGRLLDAADRGFRGKSADLRDEAVALAGHRPDQIPILSERLAQRRDLDHKVVLFYHRVRPDSAQNLVLGDEPAARLNEDHEHIEGAAAKLDRDPIGAELPAVRQQPEPTELDSPQGLVGQLHGYLLRCFNGVSYLIKGVKLGFAQRFADKNSASGALAVVKEPVAPWRHRLTMRRRRQVLLLDDFRKDHPRRQGL